MKIAPRVQLAPNYGMQKIRVDLALDPDNYYPSGASLEGAVVHAVETDPSGAFVREGSCTLDQLSATTAGCGGPYIADPGDTVVFTQTVAPDGPGILADPQPVTVGPCVVPAPAIALAAHVVPAALPADLPACGIGPVGSPLAVAAAGFGAVPSAIRSDDIFGPVVTFIDPGAPPVAKNDAATVSTGHSTDIAVLANDTTLGAPTTITVTAPTHGKATVVAGKVRYTSAAPFGGVDTFTYTITTPNGSSTATVRVTVKAPPVAVNDTARTSGGSVLVPVLHNDNGEGGTITLASASTPAHGTAAIEGTGIRYTPADGFAGTDSFTYTITTANGSATATVTITVTAPVGANSLASTGAPSGQLLGSGALLLASGAALTVAGRRRRQRA